VTRVERGADQIFARVTGVPLGGVANHTHLLIAAGSRDLPPRPSADEPKSPRPKKSRKG
jgi:hypothetical protein